MKWLWSGFEKTDYSKFVGKKCVVELGRYMVTHINTYMVTGITESGKYIQLTGGDTGLANWYSVDDIRHIEEFK